MGEQRILQISSDYEPEIGRWISAIDDTRQRTIQALDGIDPAAIDWTNPAVDNSIGTLLYHIGAIEMSYVYEDVLGIGWAPELEPLILYDVRDEQGRLWVVQGVSLEEHLTRLAQSRSLLHKAYRHLTLAEFRQPRSVANYTITPEWVLHHLMQHEAEHRGQMMEVRRLAESTLQASVTRAKE
ncbi:DinB family protein [Chloroflexi bacterium TSY]|nr:DinB family protein [Chloroflexi bacterium TSY]